ncbi:hypothetical protein V6Z12_A10G127300 [Gossypium hirsutum]
MAENTDHFEQSLTICKLPHKKHCISLFFSFKLLGLQFLLFVFPLPPFLLLFSSYPYSSPLPLHFSLGLEDSILSFLGTNSIKDSTMIIALDNSWTPRRSNSCLTYDFKPSMKKKNAFFSLKSVIWSISSLNSFTYSRIMSCCKNFFNLA